MLIPQEIKTKNIVVTGASGFIGSELSEYLISNGAKVIRISRSKLKEMPGSLIERADIEDSKTWDYIVNSADIIYHLAGNTSVYGAMKNPAQSLNSTVLPINHLNKSCMRYNRKPRVVFASTATVYGLTEQLPVTESIVVKPITIYDLHKHFAEQQLNLATQLGVFEGVSLRLSNVYGPSCRRSHSIDRGVLNKVANLALRGKDLTVYNDGNYIRDYVFIDDVVKAFICAGVCENIHGQVFNIASGTGVTIKEVFQILASEINKNTSVKVNVNSAEWPKGMDAIEFRNFIGNINKFTLLTGWRPETTIQDGIRKLLMSIVKQAGLNEEMNNVSK